MLLAELTLKYITFFLFQFEKPIFGSFNENFISYASAAMICL